MDNRWRHNPCASRPRRILNYLLDSLFLQLFYGILAIVLFIILLLVGKIDSFIQWAESLSDPVAGLMGILLYMSYYNLFEAWLGKTPAKFLTRTRVVDLWGNKPGWLDIMGRSLCRLLPFDAVSFLFGSDWHDRFSKTIVISDL